MAPMSLRLLALSVAFATAVAPAAPLLTFAPYVVSAQDDLKAKAQALVRARRTYDSQRAGLEAQKALADDEGRMRALLEQTEFPTDPLKSAREALASAVAALDAALQPLAAETKPNVVDARQKLSEALAQVPDPNADQTLAREAYANLSRAIAPAIEKLTVAPTPGDDPSAAVLQTVQAGEAAARSLALFAKVAERLDNDDLKNRVKSAQTQVAGWWIVLSGQARLAKTKIDADVEALKKDLTIDPAHPEVQYPLEAAKRVAEARRRREMALLAADALESLGTTFSSPNDLKTEGKALRASANAVRPFLELLDDRLGGAREGWEHAAIPIYYFGSVPRLMAALNLDAERFENSYFRDVDTGRTALLDAEKTRDVHRAEANRLVSDLALLRQRLAMLEAKAALDQANYDRLTRESERLQQAIDNPKNKGRVAALTQEKAAADAQKKDLEPVVQAEGAEATRLRTERTNLETAANEAATKLGKARETLNRLRLESAAIAEAEVQGFREAVRRAPFWISRARAASSDSVKRCEVFGYEDSLVVFVRGSKKDLEEVRAIVRTFDRPTPQARLTLHTLQFNGSDAEKMRIAAEAVERATVSLRGNLTVVQDVLRNAISKEVNRRARVARRALAFPSRVVLSDRVYRGFYYPREVRESLGLRVRLPKDHGVPDYLNNLATHADDLRTIESLFMLAADRFQAAEQLKDDRSASRRQMGEVEEALTQAEYLFSKFEAANETILKGVKAEAGSPLAGLQETGVKLRSAFRSDKDASAIQNVLRSVLSRVSTTSNADTSPYQTTLSGLRQVREQLDKAIDVARTDKLQIPLVDAEAADRVEYLTRFTLPDPARGTTLGELLFVFTLGGQESRQRILRDFSAELLALVRGTEAELSRKAFEDFLERAVEFTEMGRHRKGDPSYGALGLASLAVCASRLYGNASENVLDVSTRDLFPYFPRTVFGGFSPRGNPGPSDDPMTANQLEILSAIRTRVQAGVLSELDAILESDPGERDARALDRASTLALYLQDQPFRYETDAASADTFGPPPSQGRAATLQDRGNEITKLRNRSGVSRSLDEATGRVAAADDMIKRFVTVLEDDLEHFLVAPTLRAMRETVSTDKIQFGSFQSTSLLASNRGVARFDASAVATLGADPDAGAEAIRVAQQLGDLTGALGGAAGKVGGAAPFAAPLIRAATDPGTREDKLWKLGGLGLLGAALLLPDDDQPPAALYSITSGGQFKVTPILDPTGQALRFDLDYSLVTRVQEPANGTGVELPKVERQSLNIPVQVSNLEFRRVAGFEANTKVGVPPQRFGGLPFFKSLPVFKDIPLIGYFARSKGTPQARQQTYVFVQSSLYPTVSDIVGLLVDAPLRAPTQRRSRRNESASVSGGPPLHKAGGG